ncbi:hypothetical protein [Oecophyllibacter saccharovorans]|uniref:Uncharacterized protein n=1 Tax=Oecophyllibacter saccharovorans TaxID=2558360 RepID=A0A506UKN2_9PROT|nr:hypothetical protein [Oecophyllibacter saccharovorans]TPW33875.1 hypothetical protein E3202_04595 [Oecophyllibacter saccharovorans]
MSSPPSVLLALWQALHRNSTALLTVMFAQILAFGVLNASWGGFLAALATLPAFTGDAVSVVNINQWINQVGQAIVNGPAAYWLWQGIALLAGFGLIIPFCRLLYQRRGLSHEVRAAELHARLTPTAETAQTPTEPAGQQKTALFDSQSGQIFLKRLLRNDFWCLLLLGLVLATLVLLALPWILLDGITLVATLIPADWIPASQLAELQNAYVTFIPVFLALCLSFLLIVAVLLLPLLLLCLAFAFYRRWTLSVALKRLQA